MPKLMRTLFALLGEQRTCHTPAVARPQPALGPKDRSVPCPLDSPLDGDSSPLVRPYLLLHERQEARRERAFLRGIDMAVAS
ncbi:hypothetical protein [Streptomyces sp. NPDC048196]|uniref:hypothetical protein n=1 Tax=Streptomyces sp. NPDC048196 TaxID=3154712 RepID=UPI0033FBF60A